MIVNKTIMVKNILFLAAMFAMVLPSAAQVSAKWGNIDTRYPMNSADAVRTTAVNNAVAWKGERVNFQLAVTGEAGDSNTVAYRFSELKNGKNIIPATNVVGGFVQPVITDRFTGCGKHEVDAYGENLVPSLLKILSVSSNRLRSATICAEAGRPKLLPINAAFRVGYMTFTADSIL